MGDGQGGVRIGGGSATEEGGDVRVSSRRACGAFGLNDDVAGRRYYRIGGVLNGDRRRGSTSITLAIRGGEGNGGGTQGIIP